MIDYLKIIIVVVIEYLILNIVIYYDLLKKKIKFKSNKIINIIFKIIRIILILILLMQIIFYCKKIYETPKINKEIQANFNQVSFKINEEYEYYEKIKNNYNLEKKMN